MNALPNLQVEGEPIFTIRQTNLRMLEEECPAGAWAKAVEGRSTPSGEGARRGTAIHEIFGRYANYLARTMRPTDFDAVEDIAAEVLRENPGLNFSQRKEILEQARNIAEGFLMIPEDFYGNEVALETIIELEQGVTVRVTGTLDLLQMDDEGVAHITDAKSNHVIFPDSRVHNDFQLMVYAMLVFDKFPEVEVVKGHLWMTRYNIMIPQKGEALWTREEIEELRAHLALRLGAFLRGELRNEFVPGIWCQYCPRRRPGDCTLYRSYYGNVPPPPLTDDQARKMARQIMTLEDARETRLALLKDYVNEHGPVSVGSGDKAEAFAFHVSESAEYESADVYNFLTSPEIAGEIGNIKTYLGVFKVDKSGKVFKALDKALGGALRGMAKMELSTRFGHKSEREDR